MIVACLAGWELESLTKPEKEELFSTIISVCSNTSNTAEQRQCLFQAILSLKQPSSNDEKSNEHWSAEYNFQSDVNAPIPQRTEAIIQNELAYLLGKNYLSNDDINTLKDNIELNYVNSCGNTKWSYHMLQSADGKEKIFNRIVLNVNLCSSSEYVNNLDKYVRQIFIHELAHYLYFFKDPYASKFWTFCWTTSKCQTYDFVSAYAMQSKEEDYAESFVAWYLYHNWNQKMIVDHEHGSALSSAINQIKHQYFDELYHLSN